MAVVVRSRSQRERGRVLLQRSPGPRSRVCRCGERATRQSPNVEQHGPDPLTYAWLRCNENAELRVGLGGDEHHLHADCCRYRLTMRFRVTAKATRLKGSRLQRDRCRRYAGQGSLRAAAPVISGLPKSASTCATTGTGRTTPITYSYR
jgi:hypothetical protein